MTRHRLENSVWGFASNCFVCEEANPAGLRIPFFHDDETGTVVADVELADAFSGAPSYAHGGIVLAILDEAMAWATIAIERTFAVTGRTEAEFLRPVRIGRPYRVEARVSGRSADGIDTAAQILSATTGKVSAVARATFVPLDAAHTRAAVGREVSGADASFIARRGPAPPADRP